MEINWKTKNCYSFRSLFAWKINAIFIIIEWKLYSIMTWNQNNINTIRVYVYWHLLHDQAQLKHQIEINKVLKNIYLINYHFKRILGPLIPLRYDCLCKFWTSKFLIWVSKLFFRLKIDKISREVHVSQIKSGKRLTIWVMKKYCMKWTFRSNKSTTDCRRLLEVLSD